MVRIIRLILPLLILCGSIGAATKPKLVVAIMVDQFRYDYLTRFRGEYDGGLARLLERGAVFTNANYEHFPTVTAVGHSTLLSGATPSVSGIIGNDWYDRESGMSVTSVFDPKAKPLGGAAGGSGASPRRLLVSTLGDEIKMAGVKSKAIGISMKDRSAILPVGHMADAAYWLNAKSGLFVSSDYYFEDLPAWVKKYNDTKSVNRYAGTEWDLRPLGGILRKMDPEPGPKYYDGLPSSPWGNEILVEFAQQAITNEKLGANGGTDILALSLSSNDYIGHTYGPDSPEVHDISVRTDKLLAKFFAFIDQKIGLDNVIVVMSADHGVAPVPEVNQARKMPGGRMPPFIIQETITKRLTDRYGEGTWILSPSDHSIWLNRELIRQKKLNEGEVQRVAADAAMTVPHVARAYTRTRLSAGTMMEDDFGKRVLNGYNEARGADIMIVLEPYWMYSKSGTTHGAPFLYDTHVPVIFMGPGIKPGKYRQKIAVNDIAPTLAAILDVDAPSGNVGRVLEEILVD